MTCTCQGKGCAVSIEPGVFCSCMTDLEKQRIVFADKTIAALRADLEAVRAQNARLKEPWATRNGVMVLEAVEKENADLRAQLATETAAREKAERERDEAKAAADMGAKKTPTEGERT